MTKKNDFLDEISGKELNFLIGSGAAYGAIPTLWINSIEKSFEKLLTSDDYEEKEKDVLYYIWFNLWISKTLVLERTDEYEELHREYDKFVRNIVQVLNSEGYDKPKRANIFTTNYDTFFELAFDEYAAKNRLTHFNDGSTGFLKKYISTEDFYINASHSGINYNFQRSIPVINLVKLHGSVTWIKAGELIEVSLENKMYQRIKELSDNIDKFLINTEFEKLSGSKKKKLLHDNMQEFMFSNNLELTEIKDLISNLPQELYDRLKQFKYKYNELSVVSPTKRKFSETVFEQHYYQMLRMLSFELEREHSVLIVFGFSFADEHIREIVRRSMVNPYLQIYVIAHSQQAENEIKELLGSETRVKYFPENRRKGDGNEIEGNFKFFNSLFEEEDK